MRSGRADVILLLLATTTRNKRLPTLALPEDIYIHLGMPSFLFSIAADKSRDRLRSLDARFHRRARQSFSLNYFSLRMISFMKAATGQTRRSTFRRFIKLCACSFLRGNFSPLGGVPRTKESMLEVVARANHSQGSA